MAELFPSLWGRGRRLAWCQYRPRYVVYRTSSVTVITVQQTAQSSRQGKPAGQPVNTAQAARRARAAAGGTTGRLMIVHCHWQCSVSSVSASGSGGHWHCQPATGSVTTVTARPTGSGSGTGTSTKFKFNSESLPVALAP